MGAVKITDYEEGKIWYKVETEDDEEEHLYVVALFIWEDEWVELDWIEKETSSSSFSGSFRSSEISRGNDYSVEVWIDDNWDDPDYRDDLFFPWLQAPILDSVDIDGNLLTAEWYPNDEYADTFIFNIRQYGTSRWWPKYPLDGDDEVYRRRIPMNVYRFKSWSF